MRFYACVVIVQRVFFLYAKSLYSSLIFTWNSNLQCDNNRESGLLVIICWNVVLGQQNDGIRPLGMVGKEERVFLAM